MLGNNLLGLFVMAVQIYSVTPVIHTLNYFMTASRNGTLPEYVEVVYVDDVQILQFDSNHRKMNVKHDWVNKISEDDPHFWKREMDISYGSEQDMKNKIEIAKKHFNQTGGVHMIQLMYVCEWDDETGEVDAWEQYCYDGEYFLSFEGKTMKWIAANLQAFSTKKWDQIDGLDKTKKNVPTEECPSYLKTHVRNGRDFLTRTELPKVFLLQKTPSSPVTCHATGFYPKTSTLFWRKNGEEIHKDVENGETLPNHDGTFQASVHLKVEVTPAAEQEYECVFKLDSVLEDIVTKLDARSILSNAHIREEEDRKRAVAIGVPLVILTLVAMAVVVVAMILTKRLKRKQAEYSQACKEEKPKRKEEEEEEDEEEEDEEGQLSVSTYYGSVSA